MLQLPHYPNPYSTTPFPAASAWISMIMADFGAGAGRVVLNIHPDADSANSGLPPIAQQEIRCGQSYGSGPGAVVYPSLALVVADNAEHFAAIEAYLYAALLTLPQFAGATLV